ncbi:MAG: MBL fold metallo-hydrolase [bacterium]|nr:MBL fold metallo-hydrolase [bacterium]
MEVRIWGMRGGLPVFGAGTSRYGGNTACVEVRCGKTLIILDAGSGMFNLGLSLMAEAENGGLDAHLFLSHVHWDHIMGLPFFTPVYQSPGKITVYGVAGTEKQILSLFQGAEAGEYFPVPLGKPSCEIIFQELKEKTEIGDVVVGYHYLNHPGLTIGFRVEHEGKVLVYMPDNEPYRITNKPLVRDQEDDTFLARIDRENVHFARSANLLISDAAYSDEEMTSENVTKGHSSVAEALKLAMSTMAQKLVLFHHQPMRTDNQIDILADGCRKRVEALKSKLEILTPMEGELITL